MVIALSIIGGEAQDFLSLLTVKAAKDLQLDMSVKR